MEGMLYHSTIVNPLSPSDICYIRDGGPVPCGMNVTLKMKINVYCGALYTNSKAKIITNARKYCQQFDTIQYAAAQRTFIFLTVTS
jgi:hypothetical protein